MKRQGSYYTQVLLDAPFEESLETVPSLKFGDRIASKIKTCYLDFGNAIIIDKIWHDHLQMWEHSGGGTIFQIKSFSVLET